MTTVLGRHVPIIPPQNVTESQQGPLVTSDQDPCQKNSSVITKLPGQSILWPDDNQLFEQIGITQVTLPDSLRVHIDQQIQ
jgi:hypothetical protein